jgi:spore germination protein GerM
MKGRRTTLRIGIVLVVLALCGACGVPTHDSAHEVDAKEVPFQLLDEQAGPPVQEPVGAEEKLIYFARDERLVPTTRRLAPATTPSQLLDALGRGPNRNEVDAGLRSALPDESRFPDVAVSRGTATIDLGRRFTALSGEDQVMALAQLVYTVTAQPGIGLVRFTLDGRPTEVPRANGSLTSGPVSRDDYLAVAPVG